MICINKFIKKKNNLAMILNNFFENKVCNYSQGHNCFNFSEFKYGLSLVRLVPL